jgi:putative transcriptional regulator
VGKTKSPSKAKDGMTARGREIVRALEELAETLEVGIPLEERFTVREVVYEAAPSEYSPADVKAVRDRLGMSQTIFAQFLGVDATTIRSWEQGKRSPSMMARRFLDEIRADTPHWKKRFQAMCRTRTVGKPRK